MGWTGGEKVLVVLAVAAAVFAVQYGCSKKDPAPVVVTQPAMQPATIVPKAPEAPAITATSEQAQPAKQSAAIAPTAPGSSAQTSPLVVEKTTPVVLNPVKSAVKQPSSNRQANGEAAAYAKAEANKRRAFCLTYLVDWKAERDIRAGSISDLGNVREAEPKLCQLVVDLYYKK